MNVWRTVTYVCMVGASIVLVDTNVPALLAINPHQMARSVSVSALAVLFLYFVLFIL